MRTDRNQQDLRFISRVSAMIVRSQMQSRPKSSVSSRRRSSARWSAGTDTASSTCARMPPRKPCSPPRCSGRPTASRQPSRLAGRRRGPQAARPGAQRAVARQREERIAVATPQSELLAAAPDADAAPSTDDSLILLFSCCHPAISTASQIALTLRQPPAIGDMCPPDRCGQPAVTLADRPRDGRTLQGSSISAVRIERTAHPVLRGDVSAD
jgi:hypothetical protein